MTWSFRRIDIGHVPLIPSQTTINVDAEIALQADIATWMYKLEQTTHEIGQIWIILKRHNCIPYDIAWPAEWFLLLNIQICLDYTRDAPPVLPKAYMTFFNIHTVYLFCIYND